MIFSIICPTRFIVPPAQLRNPSPLFPQSNRHSGAGDRRQRKKLSQADPPDPPDEKTPAAGTKKTELRRDAVRASGASERSERAGALPPLKAVEAGGVAWRWTFALQEDIGAALQGDITSKQVCSRRRALTIQPGCAQWQSGGQGRS